jgi:N-acyl-L-homoserine lactone synthetase
MFRKKIKFIQRVFKYLFLPKKYTILVATEPEILGKMHKFRYEKYCLEHHFLNADDYRDATEHDLYDDNSVHIVACDEQKNVVGMLRLIFAAKTKLPTEHEYYIEKKLAPLNRSEIVEVSRFVVDKKYKGFFVSLDLLKFAFFYSKNNNIFYWVGTIESWLYDYTKRMFGEVEIIADKKFIFNTWNYPFLLNLLEIERKLKKTKPLIAFLFLKK